MASLNMFTKTLRKSALDVRIPLAVLPPIFLLPNRARYFNTTLQHVESPATTGTSQLPQNMSDANPSVDAIPSQPVPSLPRMKTSPPLPASAAPTELSDSIREMLPLLSAQPGHFISAHIHGRPYLVTQGDVVRLPFRMPGVLPGDVLRLNRASALGSRDYTLQGAPYLDERIFECRARVMGTESEPMREKVKKKQRNRRTRIVKSKHKFTILTISEVKVNDLDDIEG